MSAGPIFILGCDRSGTTMLGDIIGASEDCFVTPESHFFHDYLKAYSAGGMRLEADFLRGVLSHGRFETWGYTKPVSDLINCFDSNDPTKTIVKLLSEYKSQHGYDDSKIWVDHTPDNIFMAFKWNVIFPDCKFIHIVRDGRAVYSSLKKLEWGPQAAHYASIFWSDRVLKAIEVGEVCQNKYLQIKYEDILDDADSVIKAVCNFSEISYSREMLTGGGLALPEFTKKQHSKVGKGVDASNQNKWKSELSDLEVREFELSSYSRRLLFKFGYDVFTDDCEKINKLHLILSTLVEGWAFVRNKLYTRKLRGT